MSKTAKVSPLVLLAVFFAVSLSCNMPMISNTGANSSQNLSDLPSSTPEQPSQTPVTPTITDTQIPVSVVQENTLTPTDVPVVNPPSDPVPQTQCNRAVYISDVTYPDGAEILVNKDFAKTWRLQNAGSCTWTSGYRLIFDSGDRMNAPDETMLTSGSVDPGEMVDVSVLLKTPADVGTYKGNFRLKSPDNVVFGINNSGTDVFWVEIKAIKLQIFKPIVPLQISPSHTPTSIFKKIKPIFPLQP